MSISDEIERGIGDHGLWKQRLRNAIDSGESEWVPEQVSRDDQCHFGSWLHTCSAQCRSSPHYEKVKDLHAQFHNEAGKVLQLALTGNKPDAETAFSDLDGNFRALSIALTMEMIAWKEGLD